jgi:DNA-dependent protein kinase catalytic subunit
MNIAHWLLGIGDRHLLNVLLNFKNGRVIGIDFNLCFGAASRDLPVPELMPFRLTPQFVNVMNPMQVSGIITKCMTHSLRCFRNSKKLLKACMEVFVREPAIDWLDAAKDCYQKRTDDDVELVVADWNPSLRIELASEKLNGMNPRKVLTTELSIGAVSQRSDYLRGYLRVVNGDPQHNKRAIVADVNLTVEDQVASLIDLASDPVVLGVTYSGWCPWI